MEVKVTRVPPQDEHERQKWLILEGSIADCPAVTKRITVNVAALAAGTLDINVVVNKLRADVNEYYGRWQALQNIPDNF